MVQEEIFSRLRSKYCKNNMRNTSIFEPHIAQLESRK
jgi:hypothetical protein